MNFEEFLKPKTDLETTETIVKEESAAKVEPQEEENVELDVQKAVVEELAADKAVIEVENDDLRTKLAEVQKQLLEKEAEITAKKEEIAAKEAEIAAKDQKIATLNEELAASKSTAKNPEILRLEAELAAEKAKEVDTQERNPNALALLDRDVELPDRFPGETRDHVLEVIKEARTAAEAAGRIRRAQLLEGVLAANEPNGMLAKRRTELEKLFADNQNVINGTVLAELERLNISHKHGETYLLPSEIINRTY